MEREREREIRKACARWSTSESVNPVQEERTNHRGSILVNLSSVSFASRNSGFNNTPEELAGASCYLAMHHFRP